MLRKVNLLSELVKEREALQQEYLVTEVQKILNKEVEKEQRIAKSLSGNMISGLPPDDKNIPGDRIFSETEIKTICIRYKMRFLDSKLFKGEIPYAAMAEIKKCEKRLQTELTGFRIIAPARLFKLADADADPMLFAQLANGSYYFIHKWGTDMKWYRRALAFPSQSLQNLVVFLIGIAAIVALITPNNWIVPESPMADASVFGYWGFHRITFFFHFLILIGGFTVFFRFAFHNGLSEDEWDKKTFN